MQKKASTPPEALCSRLPIEFSQYLQYCRRLKFEDRPDYAHLRGLLTDIVTREGCALDHVFDWTTSGSPTSPSQQPRLQLERQPLQALSPQGHPQSHRQHSGGETTPFTQTPAYRTSTPTTSRLQMAQSTPKLFEQGVCDMKMLQVEARKFGSPCAEAFDYRSPTTTGFRSPLADRFRQEQHCRSPAYDRRLVSPTRQEMPRSATVGVITGGPFR